jgi:hypothetical protein
VSIKKKNIKQKSSAGVSGKLRIGDNWNAVTIIALSQSNPLKAIAEFVENSIDAGARKISIIRGKQGPAQNERPDHQTLRTAFSFSDHVCRSIGRAE